MNDTIYVELSRIVGEKNVEADVPMASLTSFKIGGPADAVVTVHDADELAGVVAFAREQDIPYFLLGNGTNVLAGDGGYRGIIVSTRKMNRITVDGAVITCQSGAMLSAAAKAAMEASLSGMAFASGIPGTIGGAVVMNAGAYGGEMKDIVETVTVLDDDGGIQTLSRDDCAFGYRDSVIKQKGMIVLSVNLRLRQGDYNEIKETMKALNAKRREKQPLNYPSAGSTFKRPTGHFAAKLIEDAGLKGYRVGDACVSTKHSGFIVNMGKATSKDVLSVIAHVQAEVKRQFDVELEPEVIILGEI